MKNFFFHPRYYFHGPGAVGLFILRVIFGYAMAVHGLSKIQSPGGPLGWMGPNGPHPILQGIAALTEFFGGLAIMFGLLTPLACFGVMCIMFVAVLSSLLKGGALVGGSGAKENFELAAMYFLFALVIFLTGPGLLSVDAALTKLMGKRNAATPTP